MKKKYSLYSCLTIGRNSMVFYSPDFTELDTLPLTGEIINDLEIVNQSALERIVRNWLRQTQIEPKTLAIYFLEETYFFQDKNNVAITVDDPQVVAFTETVPFANSMTKVFPLQGGARITVINSGLIKPIITVLEKCGFSVIAASPAFAAGITPQTPFSVDIAKRSLTNRDLVSTYNFIADSEVDKKLDDEDNFLSTKFDRKLVALMILFVLLLTILIALVIFQMNSPK